MTEEKHREALAVIVSDLLHANEQAFAILAASVGNVIGRDALSSALDRRIGAARNASRNAARDLLLETAQKALKVK